MAAAVFASVLVLVAVGCGGSSSSSSSSSTGSTATQTTSSTATTSTGGAYPEQIVHNFLDACEQNSPASLCECSIHKLEAGLALSDFVKIDQAMAEGASLPARVRRMVKPCLS